MLSEKTWCPSQVQRVYMYCFCSLAEYYLIEVALVLPVNICEKMAYFTLYCWCSLAENDLVDVPSLLPVNVVSLTLMSTVCVYWTELCLMEATSELFGNAKCLPFCSLLFMFPGQSFTLWTLPQCYL